MSGTAFAATLITGADIKNGTITGADIAEGSITGGRLVPEAVDRYRAAPPTYKRTTSGNRQDQTAYCSAGDTAIGGGYEIYGAPGWTAEKNNPMPYPGDTSGTPGWTVSLKPIAGQNGTPAQTPSPGTWTVFVVCMKPAV